MKWADLRLRARALIFRTRVERDLNEELDFHVEMQTRKNLSRGMSPEEARRQALIKFGGVPGVAEQCRDQRGLNLIDNLLRDIRYGVRTLARSPGFTATALLTLSIGIAATTAIFSQVNAVFWRKLPVTQPEQLRTLVWTSPQRGFLNTPAFPGPRIPAGETFGSYSYPAYKAMLDGTRDSFSDLACWMDPGELLPVVMGQLGFGLVQFVSGNYFRTLGVSAMFGRTIQPEDDREGSAAAVAVVSHRFWQRTFGGDPDVLSRTISLNGNPFAIIGVLPRDFFGVDPSISPDLMVPITMFHIASVGGVGVLGSKANWSLCRVVGRIKPGVSDEKARASAEYWVHQGAVDRTGRGAGANSSCRNCGYSGPIRESTTCAAQPGGRF